MPEKIGFAHRGPYEWGEDRPPLRDRPAGGSWTPFEEKLFNLVTMGYDRGPTGGRRPLFSRRLAAVEAALAAIDREIGGQP